MSGPGVADVPPFVAKETERMVLGACLAFDDLTELVVNEGLRETHFWSRHHQIIWRRLVQAHREQLGPSLVTVHSLLAKYGEIEEVSPAYLSGLVSGMPRPRADAIHALAARLIECAVGRDAMGLMRTTLVRLEEQPALLTEGLFTELQTSLQALAVQLQGKRLPAHVAHVSEVMEDVMASLREGPPEFVDTPWPALNSMLGGGFAPGELVYLGARPGVGKTAAALEIACRAGRHGNTVFVVSREMRTRAIGLRMLSREGTINSTRLRTRNLKDLDWEHAAVATERLSQLPVFLTHENVDVSDIRRLVGAFVDEGALGLLIVDYLQLVDPPKGIRGERRHEVEAVSKALKAITLEWGIPVLCLSSLSRPADGKAPTLASLRESGNLEHDADTVIFLHRPKELEPKTECIVAKARNGRTGMQELFFRGEFQRFEEPYAMEA